MTHKRVALFGIVCADCAHLPFWLESAGNEKKGEQMPIADVAAVEPAAAIATTTHLVIIADPLHRFRAGRARAHRVSGLADELDQGTFDHGTDEILLHDGQGLAGLNASTCGPPLTGVGSQLGQCLFSSVAGSNPEQRLRYMIEDARIKVIISVPGKPRDEAQTSGSSTAMAR